MTITNDKIYLSIVIPAWNEEIKIVKDIKNINDYFSQKPFNTELIIVDDGSSDNTQKAAREIAVSPRIKRNVLKQSRHCGKGSAVRNGITNSTGKYVLFMDSGATIPLSYVDKALNILENSEQDFLIGSRHLPESIIHHKLVWYRRVVSFFFRFITKRYLQLPGFISDTQCGFKVFKGGIGRSLFTASLLDGFLFDLEIILLAIKRNIAFTEMAVEWNWDSDSRLSVKKSFPDVYKELRSLKQRFS